MGEFRPLALWDWSRGRELVETEIYTDSDSRIIRHRFSDGRDWEVRYKC